MLRTAKMVGGLMWSTGDTAALPSPRWLRSADVRILRQLVAVHEGIEAMRWLMEERGALASHGSSLTGSLNNLVTVEEQGPSMSACRESQRPTQDLTETTSGEESADQPPHTGDGDSNNKSYFDRIPESSDARPLHPSRHGGPSSSPASGLVSAKLHNKKSQPQDSAVAPLKDIKDGANSIRRALMRSNRTRRGVKGDNGSFSLTKQSGETHTEHQTQETFRSGQRNKVEEESVHNRETALLAYDAQWCWVESQDDVMFL
ncbi:leucine rich adaptor protein 1 isoform X2 [Etheostoma spectabile]|uniref:leucine rich adaptor protein 1 isoform X2 n=1 Tax=Etheostoma spectabile TaxID=54343 RepID=UPI0013AEAA0F|nr:leucine rich adaptor protein 1-like isoform X2 [Etheostoma spectabile]